MFYNKSILANYMPKRLIILFRDELKPFEMQQEFNEPCMRYFIGNVIGSLGSVVPFFKGLLDKGAEFLSVTPPDFLSIQQIRDFDRLAEL